MITLNKSTIALLKRWAAKFPLVEVCGMVWEHPATGVQTVWPLQNMHSQPDKYYAIDPRELRDAFEVMDHANAIQLAFYHSHPGGKPDPSEEDMKGALNVGLHYLIVYPEIKVGKSIALAKWQVTAWDCIEMGVLLGDDILEGKG